MIVVKFIVKLILFPVFLLAILPQWALSFFCCFSSVILKATPRKGWRDKEISGIIEP